MILYSLGKVKKKKIIKCISNTFGWNILLVISTYLISIPDVVTVVEIVIY